MLLTYILYLVFLRCESRRIIFLSCMESSVVVDHAAVAAMFEYLSCSPVKAVLLSVIVYWLIILSVNNFYGSNSFRNEVN